MTELLHILYHGTDETTAKKIMVNGFKEFTYFAKNLKDALKFGGDCVFEVAFPDGFAPNWFSSEFCWQIRNKKRILPDKIVRVCKYDERLIFENKQLNNEIFQSSLPYYEGSKTKIVSPKESEQP